MRSDVEAEQQHVAVLDDVVLALDAHLAGFLGARLAFAGDVVVIGDRFAGDETALEILVDRRRRPAAPWCPCVMVQARVSFGPQVK